MREVIRNINWMVDRTLYSLNIVKIVRYDKNVCDFFVNTHLPEHIERMWGSGVERVWKQASTLELLSKSKIKFVICPFKHLETCTSLVVKTSLPSLQAPFISSKETPTGSSRFQALHRWTDTHDPLLQTGWTARTPPHPHLCRTTSPCLCLHLQEGRSSGRDGGRRERRRKQQQAGWGAAMEIHIKTEVRTSGHSVAAKMELWVAGRPFLMQPCCWLHAHCWLFKTILWGWIRRRQSRLQTFIMRWEEQYHFHCQYGTGVRMWLA